MLISSRPPVPGHWGPSQLALLWELEGGEAWIDCRGGSIFFKACRKLMVGGAVMKINERALPSRFACMLVNAAAAGLKCLWPGSALLPLTCQHS